MSRDHHAAERHPRFTIPALMFSLCPFYRSQSLAEFSAFLCGCVCCLRNPLDSAKTRGGGAAAPKQGRCPCTPGGASAAPPPP